MKPIALHSAKFRLTGGVDTKIEGMSLPEPKLQVAENVLVDKTGSIQRRMGRSALTNSVQGSGTAQTNWTALANYYGSLLGLTFGDSGTAGKAYEYSETAAKWVDKGVLESARIRSQNIAKSGGEAGAWAGDSATANGVTVHAYQEHQVNGANINSSVRITVTDAGGVVLKSAYTLFTITSAAANLVLGIKCVARGNLLYIWWFDPTAVAIKVAIIDASTSTTLGLMEPTPVSFTAAIDPAFPVFDVTPNVTHGIFVAWNDSTALRISYAFCDTAGAAVAGSTTTQATAADPISIAVDASPGLAMHGIAYALGTVPNDVYALHRSWNGAAWSGLVGPSTPLDTGLGADPVVNLACRYQSGGSTALRVFYTSGTVTYPFVRQAGYTTAGVISSNIATLRHSILASKPLIGPDTLLYYWVFTGTFNRATQPTNYLYNQNNVVVGQAVNGDALLPVVSTVTLPQIQQGGSAPFLTFGVSMPYYIGTLAATSFASNIAMRRTSFELAHNESHASTCSGQSAYVAGAYLSMYDGQGCVESNFLRPLNTLLVSSAPSNTAPGALTLLSIYSYMVVYSWKNIRGEQEWSTNLGAYTAPILAGAEDTLTLTVPTLSHTRKLSPRGAVSIQFYRTEANPTDDSEHHLVGEVANDPTVNTVSFVDTMSDTIAATAQTYPFDDELDNTAPPPGHILAEGNGRVYLAGFPDKTNVVMASKIRVPGRALEFSDFLPNITLAESAGPITALAMLNRTLIIFTAHAIYRSDGEGPSNTGAGEFGTPNLINSDTGTDLARSVVTTPLGIMFEGAKGKMLVNQAFGVEYIGAPLEKLADPGECRGCVLLPSFQQVRWSYDQTTHVFDYYHALWHVYTHGSEGPTAYWNEVHAAVSEQLVVYDDPLNFDDAGTDYTARIRLGWMHSSETLQADLRIRKVGLTGQSMDEHYLSVNIYFDQETTLGDSNVETVASAGSLATNWRILGSRQVCSMIEVEITDALTDIYGADVVLATAGWRLSELVFEMGIRGENIMGRG